MHRTANPLLAALVLASLLPLHPARGDSLADEADYRFRRGTAAFRAGRVDDALGEFLFSNRLVRNKNVLFDIARCYELLKQPNEAYRWYAEILAEPGLPEAERDAVQASLQRLAPSLALARISSSPPGATVYVGRKDLGARGRTPVTLALPPGQAVVTLELDGYRPVREELPLAVGRTLHVEERLLRIVGRLEVKGKPARYTLRVDSADSAPVLSADGTFPLPPGSHPLFIEAPGHAPLQLDAVVVADEETPVRFELVPLPPPSGTLVIRANVDGALVRLDGKELGFTPLVRDGVPVGRHKLTVTADGREPWEQEVALRENERAPVEARLRWALPRVQAAERHLTLASDAPSSITILTAQEIHAFGWLTLAEALRSVRGLFTTDDRGYTSLGVRGYSAPGTYNNRVLVLSDGHVTNDLSLGQGFIGQDFDTDLTDVERIEVVRGAGSVLYGSAAFLAVINVVHRTPASGAHGSVGAVALDQSGLHGSLSVAGEDRWLSLHAGAFGAEGERTFVSPMATGAAAGFARGVDGERAAHADLRARLGGFTLAASYNQRSKELPTAAFDTVFGLPGTDTRDSRFFAEAAWERALGAGVTFDARLSYDGRRHDSALQYRGADPLDPGGHPGSNGRVADWVDAEVRVRHDATLAKGLTSSLFAGAEVQDVFRVRLSSQTPAGSVAGATVSPGEDHAEQVWSAYLGDDLRLHDRVSLDAALRVDDHGGSFGVAVNPRVALIAQPYEGGNFKLVYGTAYRAPSFYERYFTNGASQLPGNRCAAGGACTVLDPETVRTGEFEHAHRFNDALSVLVAGYWSRIANILRLTGAGGGKFAFGNRSTLTHSAGLELEGRWQPEPGLLVSAWYAWAHVTNDNGFIVPNVPTHTAAVRVLWPVLGEALSLSTEAIYGSSRYTIFVDNANLETEVGEQLIWNLGLSGQTPGGLRYGVLVQDVLDQRPLLPAGFEVPFLPKAVPQAGRMLRVTVGGSF